MEFNYNKLRGRIIEKFETIGKFAEVVGVTFESISKKLNNKTAFGQKEIVMLCDVLDIPYNEIGVYFFNLKVQEAEL